MPPRSARRRYTGSDSRQLKKIFNGSITNREKHYEPRKQLGKSQKPLGTPKMNPNAH